MIALMVRVEVIAQVLRHASDEGFTETPVPGLRVFRQSVPTVRPMPTIYDPSICVITQGTKRLRVGDRAITYDPWNYLISAFTLPVEAEIPEATPEEPFLGFVIRFDPVLVAKLLAEIDDLMEWPKNPPREVIGACPMTEDLLRTLTRLLGCIDDATDRRVLAAGLIRETLYQVLRGPRGWVLREQALRGGSTRQVGRAVAFLEQRFREPLDVETIARNAAMSPSALHQHFKQLTGLSPIQYVQRLRLHEARALLLGGRTAAEAGFEVGYKSPSQFSREFRRLFGVPPSQLRSVKAGPLRQAAVVEAL